MQPLDKNRLCSFLIFTGVFLYLNYGFWERWDLPIYDGLYYFQKAARWPAPDLFLNREWSPLYIIFYAGFQRVLAGMDPFWIYAVHRLLVLYLIVLVYWRICLRFLDWRLATIATIILACNRTLLDSFHVIHAVALLFVLVTIWLAAKRSQGAATLLALIVCGIFVRPEFIAAFLMLLLFLLVMHWRGRPVSTWKPDWKAVLCLMAALTLGMISASQVDKPSRAFAAFSQQGAWAAEGESSVAAGFQHRERAAGIYGDSDTLLEALWTNPAAFLKTIFSNLISLPRALIETLAHRGSPIWLAPLSVLLLAAAGISFSPARERPATQFWVCGTAFALAAIAASTIIRPTAPYLLPAVPVISLGVAFFSAEFSSGRLLNRLGRPAAILLGAAVALLVALTGASLEAKGQPILDFSKQLAAAPPAGPLRVMAYAADSYCLHTLRQGLPCSGIGPEALLQQPDLRVLLKQRQISAVVVDVPMRQAAAEFQNPDLAAFEAAPELFGFRLASQRGGGLLAELFAELPWDKTSRLYLSNGAESPD